MSDGRVNWVAFGHNPTILNSKLQIIDHLIRNKPTYQRYVLLVLDFLFSCPDALNRLRLEFNRLKMKFKIIKFDLDSVEKDLKIDGSKFTTLKPEKPQNVTHNSFIVKRDR
jgi:hypothetical protein